MRNNDEFEQALDTLRKLKVDGIRLTEHSLIVQLSRKGHLYAWNFPLAKVVRVEVNAAFALDEER